MNVYKIDLKLDLFQMILACSDIDHDLITNFSTDIAKIKVDVGILYNSKL